MTWCVPSHNPVPVSASAGGDCAPQQLRIGKRRTIRRAMAELAPMGPSADRRVRRT
jgi:hypothetical protein